MRRTRVPALVTYALVVFLGLRDIRRHLKIVLTTQVQISPSTQIDLDPPDIIAKRKNMTLYPPTKVHPFAGARDANGHWGYIADPKLVRHYMLWQFRNTSQNNADASFADMEKALFMPLNDDAEVNETEQVCETPPEMGIEGKAWFLCRNVRRSD
jgi:hypothetical protein